MLCSFRRFVVAFHLLYHASTRLMNESTQSLQPAIRLKRAPQNCCHKQFLFTHAVCCMTGPVFGFDCIGCVELSHLGTSFFLKCMGKYVTVYINNMQRMGDDIKQSALPFKLRNGSAAPVGFEPTSLKNQTRSNCHLHCLYVITNVSDVLSS